MKHPGIGSALIEGLHKTLEFLGLSDQQLLSPEERVVQASKRIVDLDKPMGTVARSSLKQAAASQREIASQYSEEALTAKAVNNYYSKNDGNSAAG